MILSGELAGLKVSVTLPNITANRGRATPFAIADMVPMIIKSISIPSANLNSLNNDTGLRSGYFEFFS